METIKENLFKYATFLLAGLVLILLVKGCDDNSNLRDIKRARNAELKIYQKKDSSWAAQKEILVGEKATVKALYEKRLDSAKKQVSSRNVINVIDVEQVVYDTITTELYEFVQRNSSGGFDTLRGFKYEDKLISLRATINRFDSIRLIYRLTIPLTYVEFKRKGRHYAEVVSSDWRVKIIGMNAFRIEKKPKRLGIGLQAGYGITPSGLGPYLGVGFSYNLIRL